MEPDYSYPPQREGIPPRRSAEPRMRSRLPLLIVILIALVALWFYPTYAERVSYSRTRGRVQAIREGMTSMELKNISQAFVLTAESIGPSVVHIDVRRTAYRSHQFQGQGSGVIVDTEGYIVTNNHVIEGATDIQVHLSDGRHVPAAAIGADPTNDLAVLKINAGDLIAAEWGDSNALQVGELVWACGNPFGLDRSITLGIVSAKGRSGVTANIRQEFLQTDAAINPGNSGGPLVDIEGKIVGINTAIIGPSFSGVGFAIPSAVAQERYEYIREHGAVPVRRAGFIGVALEDVDEETARKLNLPVEGGALVVGVVPNGPADDAGIQPGDIIVRWNGEDVPNRAAFTLLVSRSEVGSVVEMGIIRDGEPITLEIEVGERPQALMQFQPQR